MENIETQTLIDIIRGKKVANQQDYAFLDAMEKLADGILKTQLRELEDTKSELIKTQSDLQNALSEPVLEVPVQE